MESGVSRRSGVLLPPCSQSRSFRSLQLRSEAGCSHPLHEQQPLPHHLPHLQTMPAQPRTCPVSDSAPMTSSLRWNSM